MPRFTKHFRPLLLGILSASPAFAASQAEMQQSKYLRYAFCMDRALGDHWWEKHNVRLQLNRWGVSHPTAGSMLKAPPAVQREDARCRKENEITEPRPVGPGQVQG